MNEISYSTYRAVEWILYLAERLENPTIHEILKLRYFADKIHMERYGFLASGDSYDALEYGPVASSTYDLLKAAQGRSNSWTKQEYLSALDRNLTMSGNTVVPQRSANVRKLTEADVECLNEALEKYGNMTFGERTDLSHDDAWNAAWRRAKLRGAERERMPSVEIARTLSNYDDIVEHLMA